MIRTGDSRSGDPTLINVFVGRRSDGSDVLETLWVDGRPDGLYQLTRSPLFLLGVAPGDTFEVDLQRTVTSVAERGDCLTVQVVAAGPVSPPLLETLAGCAAELGGVMDTHGRSIVALTLPRAVDRAQLVRALAKLEADRWIENWWISSTHALITRD